MLHAHRGESTGQTNVNERIFTVTCIQVSNIMPETPEDRADAEAEPGLPVHGAGDLLLGGRPPLLRQLHRGPGRGQAGVNTLQKNKIIVRFEQKISSDRFLSWIILSKALSPV